MKHCDFDIVGTVTHGRVCINKWMNIPADKKEKQISKIFDPTRRSTRPINIFTAYATNGSLYPYVPSLVEIGRTDGQIH